MEIGDIIDRLSRSGGMKDKDEEARKNEEARKEILAQKVQEQKFLKIVKSNPAYNSNFFLNTGQHPVSMGEYFFENDNGLEFGSLFFSVYVQGDIFLKANVNMDRISFFMDDKTIATFGMEEEQEISQFITAIFDYMALVYFRVYENRITEAIKKGEMTRGNILILSLLLEANQGHHERLEASPYGTTFFKILDEKILPIEK